MPEQNKNCLFLCSRMRKKTPQFFLKNLAKFWIISDKFITAMFLEQLQLQSKFYAKLNTIKYENCEQDFSFQFLFREATVHRCSINFSKFI